MLTYELDNTKTEPLYIQIYEYIRTDIENGTLSAGDKLPSKREFSAHLGVSVITVENAYAQLVAEGYVAAYPKKGYFVEHIPQVKSPIRNDVILPEKTEEISESDDSLFPFSVWSHLMRETLARDRNRLMAIPPSEGVYELREAIADHLKSFRNMDVSPSQIVIGAGTEYLYMLTGILLGNDSVIAVEDPGYRKIAEIYTSIGMKCRWISVNQDGISVDELESSDADIVHISPSHHFPTGCVTSIGKRYALLGWATKEENRYLIEDDHDSEFRLSGKPIPSLFSVDVTDKVIYMNTFTKSLTPTIRISYMILPATLVARFHERLGCFSCAVSTFEQYTLAKFIREGYFEKHIRRVRKHCIDSRNRLIQKAGQDELFSNATFSGTNTGMYCVVRFSDRYSCEELEEELKKRDIRAVPLSEFSHNDPGQNRQRFLIYY